MSTTAAVPRKRGRPSAGKVRVSYAVDSDLPAWMEEAAKAAGHTHKRSGRPNVSEWLNATLRKMQIDSSIV